MRFAWISLAAVFGCATPTPPPINMSEQSTEGQFGRTEYVRLGPDSNEYIRAFKYQVPSAGILRATLRSATARGGQVTLAIYQEGTAEAIAKDSGAGIAEAKVSQPGVYYVAASEPFKGAVSLEVYFDVTFAPSAQ
jgi:hypothetical protein